MLTALLLTTVAGLATVIGGLLAITPSARSPRVLAAALAFAAGAMAGVSLLELYPVAVQAIGWEGPTLAALCGAAVVVGVDALAHAWQRRASRVANTAPGALAASHAPGRLSSETAPSTRAASEAVDAPADSWLTRSRLLRAGIVTAVVMTVHNIPEGFATFASALHDPALALPLVAAIALHNVPEGLAVAMPILHATGSRLRAVAAAGASGISEPLGAVALYWALGAAHLHDATEIINGAIVGVMLTISMRELIPLAHATLPWPRVAAWALAGVSVMALSLWGLRVG